MQNFEIKCPLPDRAAVEDHLITLAAERQWVRRQRDTFYEVPRGWLKLREEEGGPTRLISYRRADETGGPRVSDYDALEVPDAAAWRSLLGRVMPVDGEVIKERTLWFYHHTRIHLDRVADLGDFLELETVVRDISPADAFDESRLVIEALGLDPSTFVGIPYREMMRE